jgi:hypothetical protein
MMGLRFHVETKDRPVRATTHNAGKGSAHGIPTPAKHLSGANGLSFLFEARRTRTTGSNSNTRRYKGQDENLHATQIKAASLRRNRINARDKPLSFLPVSDIELEIMTKLSQKMREKH